MATLLLLHPGGFTGGSGESLARECRAFAAHGYLAVSVDYSHRFFPAVHEIFALARAYGARARRAHRPLLAYGLSAGGAFAAMLAERGAVHVPSRTPACTT